MSVVSQVILKADDELRYPSTGELKSIKEFLQTGEQRTRIAATLSENEKKIVQQASKQLWQKRPDFIAPGGNAYGERQRALCLRDYGWYLRLITYGVLAGDKEPIEKNWFNWSPGDVQLFGRSRPWNGGINSLPQASRSRLTESGRRSRSSPLL